MTSPLDQIGYTLRHVYSLTDAQIKILQDDPEAWAFAREVAVNQRRTQRSLDQMQQAFTALRGHLKRLAAV